MTIETGETNCTKTNRYFMNRAYLTVPKSKGVEWVVGFGFVNRINMRSDFRDPLLRQF